jgi:hypothetical protein
MNAVTEMPAPLIFTDNAANKVKELIDEEGNSNTDSRSTKSGTTMTPRWRRTASRCSSTR